MKTMFDMIIKRSLKYEDSLRILLVLKLRSDTHCPCLEVSDSSECSP